MSNLAFAFNLEILYQDYVRHWAAEGHAYDRETWLGFIDVVLGIE